MNRNVKVLFAVGFILVALAVVVGVGATQLRSGYKSITVTSHGTIGDNQQVENNLIFSSYATFAVGVSLLIGGLFLNTRIKN